MSMYFSETCSKSVVCENGGHCTNGDEGSYCVCNIGTEGDLCNVVTECESDYCGDDATCVYNVTLKKAVCRCSSDEQSYDPENKKCKRK